MNSAVSGAPEFLTGGDEMGHLIRSTDWSKSPLGPPENWPVCLRTMVRVMLDAAFPMYIAWGDSYIQFYNNAYRPILGATKHPEALGNSTTVTFAEIWHIIGPMFEQVMREGKAVGLHDFLLPLERYGYTEECYFTLSYSPIRDEQNDIRGVLVTVTETTERVLAERRLRTLRHMAERAGTVDTIEQASGMIGLTLAENAYDVPFALFYQLENDGKTARLTENVRFPDELLAGQTTIHLQHDSPARWPLAEVAASGKARLVDVQLPAHPRVEAAWPESVRQACVLPVTRPERDFPYGILVLGVSPRCAYDTHYNDFFTLLTEHAATALANATAFEIERKRTEALLEVDRLKTTFFSNISHEFRTPLTLMLGPLEDAIAEATDERNRERLELLERNALRILKLVNNLLDFARLESGRADAVFEPTDLCSLTADVASSFRSAIERAGMTFEVDCAAFDGVVYVDRQLWEKVVLNLLSNAFKFTFRGKITLRQRHRGDHIELSVADTGIGIPEEEQARVFERFHRVHNVRSRTHEGAGIGLALVQEIVRLHGGNIEVESREGAGTTFTITIPTGKAHLPADKIETKRSLVSTAVNSRAYVEEALHWLPDTAIGTAPKQFFTFGKPYVLVVDDNADMRTYIQRILEEQFNVLTAHDGAEALAAIGRQQPDLVLADVMMPQLDGFELVQQLRSDPATRTLPVILLSARAGEEARIEGLRRGADDYVVKPFSARELLSRVGTTFALAQLRQRSQSEFKNLVMQSPVAVGVLKGENLTLSIANDSMLHMWNLTSDALGRPLEELLPELDGQEFPVRLREVVSTGTAYHVHEEKICFEDSGTLCERYFSYVAQPLLGDGGAVVGVSVLLNEVTPQAIVNRQLAESETRLRLATESAELGTWEYDPDRDLVHYSERTRELFGFPPGVDVSLAQAVGVIADADQPRVLEAVRRAMQGENDGNYDVEYAVTKTADGRPRVIRARGKAFFDERNVPYRLLGTVMDITEQKRQEQLLRDLAHELEARVEDRTRELQSANLELTRSNKELEQFAYVASHDLREPLRKITVFGDRLVRQYREALTGDGELYINRMQDSARRMEQLIDDLLNFSRVARAQGLYEPTDLNTVLASVLRDLEIALGKNNAVVEMPTAPLPTIEANSSQLEKYFLNILSNALKFAREGVQPHIEIRHELIPAEESGVPAPKPGTPYLRLTIRDNGIGFEQDYAERIFGLFQRLHGRSDYQGSGIGLAICRKIAENHQGSVRAEGKLGEGAEFVLVVPVRQ